MGKRGNWLPVVFLLLLLGAFGGLGWLTRHPEAEILRLAGSWPGIGPYAERFREAYRPPSPPSLPGDLDGEAPRTVEPIVVYAPPVRDYVWVDEGQPVLREPRLGASEILRTDRLANLTLIERREDWFRIWSNRHQVEGWVHLPDYFVKDPPLGMKPDPPGPLWPRSPDPERLDEALALFEGRQQKKRLGPYTLHTDVEDPVLVKNLERVASQADRAYAERYGRVPLGDPAEHVVLYADEGAYRVQQHRSRQLHGLDATGHTSRGMVLFFKGKRRTYELQATLIHELGHLLNRRALGPALPPWLDEGLADDLSHGKVDAEGRLRPGELSGVKINYGGHSSFEGGWASLLNLEDAVTDSRLPGLEQLLGYDWQAFVGSEGRLHYDTAAFFVRFLLADEETAEAFRAFLDDVADGKTLEPELLRSRLGNTWDELDRAFREWIVEEAGALRDRG